MALGRAIKWLVGLTAVGSSYFILQKWLKDSKGSSLTWTGPVDDYAVGEDESVCDPTEKPGTKAFRAWVISRWRGYDAGIVRACNIGGPSGHKSGKSWDWGTPAGAVQVNGKPNEPAQAETFLAELFKNENELLRRAGITYLIWQRKIWSTRTKAWSPYTGPDPHDTHVHFSFSTKAANGETSLYSQIPKAS